MLGVQGGYGKVADIARTDLDNASNGNVFGGAIVGFDFALSHTISFGVESGYDYGYHIIKDNNSNLNYQMIPVLGTLKFTLPFGLQLFGKGGMAYVTERVNIGDTGFSATANAWKPMAAAGAAYTYKNWTVFAQYQYVFGDSEVNNKDQVSKFNALTAGVTYTFPLAF
ncbi:outer membrane beta-barrel protein [Cysteiniphilum sp. QT6929]|uniref:outer membrane protein n=1 Tax=Cysteiniphilum sp. QT6929 TaxID=2975055 RepID=UPI0024B3AB9B|nr:outer membrane beta-barrel protein [Cysteiniphilum sp. QT6929]WHN64767.1 porin family protein [Cysteiniphilum sp. QT6929]